jgi:hypothetical protein
VSHFHWPIWQLKVPNQHATWHVVIGPRQQVDVTATVLAMFCTDCHVLYDLPRRCTDCHMALSHWSICRPENAKIE